MHKVSFADSMGIVHGRRVKNTWQDTNSDCKRGGSSLSLPTVDDIKSICDEYGLKLEPDVTIVGNRVCPLGAMLVKKCNGLNIAALKLINVDLSDFLSQELGLSKEEIWGVIDGFDGNTPCFPNDGYTLGRECRKLV